MRFLLKMLIISIKYTDVSIVYILCTMYRIATINILEHQPNIMYPWPIDKWIVRITKILDGAGRFPISVVSQVFRNFSQLFSIIRKTVLRNNKNDLLILIPFWKVLGLYTDLIRVVWEHLSRRQLKYRKYVAGNTFTHRS